MITIKKILLFGFLLQPVCVATAVRGDTNKARQALEKKEIDAVFSIARLPVRL